MPVGLHEAAAGVCVCPLVKARFSCGFGEGKKLVARILKSEPLILKSKPLIFSLLQRGCFFTRFSGAEFLHGFLHEKIFSCKEPDFFNPNRSSGFVKLRAYARLKA